MKWPLKKSEDLWLKLKNEKKKMSLKLFNQVLAEKTRSSLNFFIS